MRKLKAMSIARIIVSVLLSILCGISYWYLLLGRSNVLTSILIYFSLFYLAHLLLSKVFGNRFSVNGRVLLWSIFLSTLILDLGLRVGTDRYRSYSERNGLFWYHCLYTQWREQNKEGAKDLHIDNHLFVGPSNETIAENKIEFSYDHSFNSFGLRENELNKDQIDSSFTIVGFGDSFTEGVGAPFDSTWVRLLDEQLKECRSDLLCVNAGRSGSDIVFETYKFKHLILETYKPDLVIFSINNSDINDLVVRGGFERFTSDNRIVFRHGPWWKYLYNFSYVWRFIAHDIMGVGWSMYTKEEDDILEAVAKDLIYSTIVNEIVPFAKDHNIITLFVFTPVEQDLDKDSFVFTELAADLEKHDINVLNLHQTFSKSHEMDKDYYWKIDRHCNSQGYLVWSKAISADIREKGLINCNY